MKKYRVTGDIQSAAVTREHTSMGYITKKKEIICIQNPYSKY
jgi:hypothetical protein